MKLNSMSPQLILQPHLTMNILTEQRQDFVINLRPETNKQLVSRGEQCQNLQTVMDASEQFERQFPPNHERSLYVDNFKQDKFMVNPYGSLTTQKMLYLWVTRPPKKAVQT